MTDVTTCYLSLGSNLGDRAGNLAEALRRLQDYPQVQILAVSSVYETDPVGPQDQPDFYNIVAQVAADCTAEELLAIIQQIEREIGRVRAQRWGPRNIDIDILLFGSETIDMPELRVPHLGLMQRQFVLVPLAEIAPDLILPDGHTAAEAVHPTDPAVRLADTQLPEDLART